MYLFSFSEIAYSSLFQTMDWFNIDNRTGSIFTKSRLDRETSAFVVISIQARAGFPPVYAVAQVVFLSFILVCQLVILVWSCSYLAYFGLVAVWPSLCLALVCSCIFLA